MEAEQPSSPLTENAPGLLVRNTEDSDLPIIQSIYAKEVLQGLATFEEVPPTVDELLSRRATVEKLSLPFLTAELDGQVVGYSYATLHRPRPAYRFTVEDSVYVAEGKQGLGIGQALLGALIMRCEAGPWREMVAIIGDSENGGSIALHRRLGFHRVGILDDSGFKLGRWVDTVIMQRALGDGGRTPPTR